MQTNNQLADILVKILGRIKFVELCDKMGVKRAWDMGRIKEEQDGGERQYFLPLKYTDIDNMQF